MSTLSLAPARLFTGAAFLDRHLVHVRDGRIEALDAPGTSKAEPLDGLLAPGFFDIQVNGGGGVLFNDAPTADTIATIAAAHARFGVTGVMATLISDERSKMKAAFAAVEEALERRTPGVVGLHLEGPWLSEPRRGVHQVQYLRDFDDEDLALIARKRPYPVLVTLAPERIELARLRALREAGVIVSIGHTAAGLDQVEAALAAGASGFTHLFNAMAPLAAREPGPAGAALADPAAWAGLILDGVHVHPRAARIAYACKGAGKLMLVSDSMATVGAEQSTMLLQGEKVSLRDGALRTEAGVLAGAHLDLAQAARNAMALIGASEADALRMTSLTPAQFLDLDSARGRIAPGARADFVLLGPQFEVRAVWIGGERVV